MKNLDLNSPWTKEEIADACEITAEILEGHWLSGNWHDELPKPDPDHPGETVMWDFYCIEGGMGVALGLDVNDLAKDESDLRKQLIQCPFYEAVRETLNIQVRDAENENNYYEEGELPEWNDNYADQQKVLDLLHATAKRVLGVEP